MKSIVDIVSKDEENIGNKVENIIEELGKKQINFRKDRDRSIIIRSIITGINNQDIEKKIDIYLK